MGIAIKRLVITEYYAFKDSIKNLIKESIEFNFPTMAIQDGYYNNTLRKLKDYLDEESAIVYLAMDEENVCGWIWCHEIHRFNIVRLHVASFAVRKQYRKMGIGKQLIGVVEEYAHNHGYSGLDLLVTRSNSSAVKFYEKQGYEVERYILRKEFDDDIKNSD